MEPKRLAHLLEQISQNQRWRNVSFAGIVLWTWLRSKSVACQVIDDRLHFYAYSCDAATLSWFAGHAGCPMQVARGALEELEAIGIVEAGTDEHRGDHYAVSTSLSHLNSDDIEDLIALGRIEFRDLFNTEEWRG